MLPLGRWTGDSLKGEEKVEWGHVSRCGDQFSWFFSSFLSTSFGMIQIMAGYLHVYDYGDDDAMNKERTRIAVMILMTEGLKQTQNGRVGDWNESRRRYPTTHTRDG